MNFNNPYHNALLILHHFSARVLCTVLVTIPKAGSPTSLIEFHLIDKITKTCFLKFFAGRWVFMFLTLIFSYYQNLWIGIEAANSPSFVFSSDSSSATYFDWQSGTPTVTAGDNSKGNTFFSNFCWTKAHFVEPLIGRFFGLHVSFLIGFKSRVDLLPALFLACMRWSWRSCLVWHLPFPPIEVYTV